METSSFQPPRFAARTRVIFEKTLSMASRVLYLALDDTARQYGYCDVPRYALAERIGLKERQVGNLLRELIAAKFIESERGSDRNRYHLTWLSDRQEIAHPVRKKMRVGRQKIAYPYKEDKLTSPPTPFHEEKQKCLCGGTGNVFRDWRGKQMRFDCPAGCSPAERKSA